MYRETLKKWLMGSVKLERGKLKVKRGKSNTEVKNNIVYFRTCGIRYKSHWYKVEKSLEINFTDIN